MPYNNTPIAPAKEITGHVSLPLARVQKIIVADPNHLTVSKNASFAIALAAEMFIQQLATTTHNVVKAERKPRRNIQYRDVSSAVAKTDNLEFLVDVVPKTTSFGAHKRGLEAQKKAAEAGKGVKLGGGEDEAASVEATLEERIDGAAAMQAATGDARSSDETVDAMDVDGDRPLQPQSRPEPRPRPRPHEHGVEESEADEDPAAMQIEMEMRGPPRSDATATPEVRRSSGFTAINGTQ